jgi:hypothetical protein
LNPISSLTSRAYNGLAGAGAGFHKLQDNQRFEVIWSLKCWRNTKKLQMRRDNDHFQPISKRGLSYQACSIPRIVRPPDMPVCGDRQPDFIFLIPRRRRDG